MTVDAIAEEVGGSCLGADVVGEVATLGADSEVGIPAAVGCVAAGTAIRDYIADHGLPRTPPAITRFVDTMAARACHNTGACSPPPTTRSAERDGGRGGETVTRSAGPGAAITAFSTDMQMLVNGKPSRSFRFKASVAQRRTSQAVLNASPSPVVTAALAFECSDEGRVVARQWSNGTCLRVEGVGSTLCEISDPFGQLVGSLAALALGDTTPTPLQPAGHHHTPCRRYCALSARQRVVQVTVCGLRRTKR